MPVGIWLLPSPRIQAIALGMSHQNPSCLPMIKKIRVFLAVAVLVCATALFLDHTGTLQPYLGFLARVQLVPALLALNLGVVAGLAVVTLVLGRVYCSILCPLGLFQDAVARLARRHRKRSYSYTKARTGMRLCVLALFVLALLLGLGSLVALLDPYASFGRMMNALVQPLVQLANNGLSYVAEHLHSYAFAPVDVWFKSVPLLVIAIATLAVVGYLAARHGRLYCNTVCPVGTMLSFLSRFALIRPILNGAKCVNCKKCERSCKASCIDLETGSIDASRCVACMNCVDVCPTGALVLGLAKAGKKDVQTAKSAASAKNARKNVASTGLSRRDFVKGSALAAVAAPAGTGKAIDGGLAKIVPKENPVRATGIVPPGAQSHANFAAHCTGCQLCVSVCPTAVLRSARGLLTLMQPEMGYERGYCRPECTRCGEVCPTGAILPITRAQKSALQIGRAVWKRDLCVSVTSGHPCDNCARHCPVEAITMMPLDASKVDGPKFPAINELRCTGCGACEYLCPARPLSAIHVEGVLVHAEI